MQDVEAVIQVFAEGALLHRGLEIDVSRRQYAHIHGNRLAAAHAFDLLFLQKTQQIGLQFHRQIADFIEKQRAAVRGFNTSDLALMGTGECPLFMPKQFGLDQVFRDRPAVDRHKRFGVALGLTMQGLGHQLFAGTTVATDQHRGFGGRQLGEQFAQFADRPTVSQQFMLGFVHRRLTLAP